MTIDVPEFRSCILPLATFVSRLCHIRCDRARPNSTSPSDECILHFPNLKSAPDGSFVAQLIPKCIVAQLFRKRGWSANGWDKPMGHKLRWDQLMWDLP